MRGEPGYQKAAEPASAVLPGTLTPPHVLLSVAEQLKVPLTTIARQAELERIQISMPAGESADHAAGIAVFDAITLQANAALRLVDSYLLSLELLASQTALELEPVSVASTLTDVAHQLSPFAKQYGTRVEVHIGGRFEPVMAHRAALGAALVGLGYALGMAPPDDPFAAGQAEAESRSPSPLILAVHRVPQGIAVGAYGNFQTLRAEQWRRAVALCGRARQPVRALASGSGAGLFVADALLQAMDVRLRVGRRLRHTGLAATLQPSRQLSLL